MRNLLYLTILYFTCLVPKIYGQSLNHTSALYHTNIATGIAIDTSGQWITIGYGGDYSAFPYWAVWNRQSASFSEYSALIEDLGGEVMNMSNLVYDPILDTYYFAIARSGCDYGQIDKLITFRIADEIFVIEDLELSYGQNYRLTVVPGEGILIANNGYETTVVSFYNGEEFIEFPSINSTNEYYEIDYWSDNRFVAISEDLLSVFSYDIMQQSISIESEVGVANINGITVLNDSTLLIIDGSDIQMRNNDLELVTENPLTSAYTYSLTYDEEYIYVATRDGIHFLNQDLVEQGFVEFQEVKNYIILDVAAQNGRIAIVGTSDLRYGFRTYYYFKAASSLFMKTYTIDGADIPSVNDISVENVTYESGNFQSHPSSDCMNVTIEGVSVEVTNMGTSILSNVVLTKTDEGCLTDLCVHWIPKTFRFLGLDLAPGESAVLDVGDVTMNHIPLRENYGLCFRASSIEGTMDMDLSNNRACESIVVVNSNEQTLSTNFDVYPTLCQDEVFLSLPESNSDFEDICIYNLLGQKEMTIPLSDAVVNGPLNVSALEIGTYFLRLEGERVSQSEKLIKY